MSKLSTLLPATGFTNNSLVYTVALSNNIGTSYKQTGRTFGLGILTQCLSSYYLNFEAASNAVDVYSGFWGGQVSFNINTDTFNSTFSTVSTLSASVWNQAYSTLSYSVCATLSGIDNSRNSNYNYFNNLVQDQGDELIDKFGEQVLVTSPFILAVTKSQRVIGWAGKAESTDPLDGEYNYIGSQGIFGKYNAYLSIIFTPTFDKQYIPFNDSTNGDYLTLTPNLSIIQLKYCDLGAICLLSDNTVWTWGENGQELGFKQTSSSFGGQTIKSVDILVYGGDYNSALGTTNPIYRKYSVIGEVSGSALTNNLWLWGGSTIETQFSNYTPTLVTTLSNVDSIGLYIDHSLVLCKAVQYSTTTYTTSSSGFIVAGVGNNIPYIYRLLGIGQPPSTSPAPPADFKYNIPDWRPALHNIFTIVNDAKKLGNKGCSNRYTSWFITTDNNLYNTSIDDTGGAFTYIVKSNIIDMYATGGNIGTVNQYIDTVLMLDVSGNVFTYGNNVSYACGVGDNPSGVPVPLPLSSTPIFGPNSVYPDRQIQVTRIKSNNTCFNNLYTTTSFLVSSTNTLYGAGMNVPVAANRSSVRPPWYSWIRNPSAYDVNTLLTYATTRYLTFSPLLVNIPKNDPIKDWMMVSGIWYPNYDASTGLGASYFVHYCFLILTSSGHVYGIGVSNNNALGPNNRTTGTGVLLI